MKLKGTGELLRAVVWEIRIGGLPQGFFFQS